MTNKTKKTKHGSKRMRHRLIEQNWLGYTGNKQAIIPLLLDLIPKHTTTFVDLFGGSGFVGASVLHDNRAENVITNEIEFLWAKMLHNISRLDPDTVINEYRFVQDFYFGDAKKLTMQNRPQWYELRDDFNNLATAWDSSKEQVERSAETSERLRKESGKVIRPDIMLMLLAKTSYHSTPKFADMGRRYSGTPNFTLFPDPERMRPFLEVWHRAQWSGRLRIFSRNFLDIYQYGRNAKRPRPEVITFPTNNGSEPLVWLESFARQGDFLQLKLPPPGSLVYADPPYLGSTGYSADYTCGMEIQLLALMEYLNANGVQ